MVELKIRSSQPVAVQLKQLNDIIKTAAKTSFGDRDFGGFGFGLGVQRVDQKAAAKTNSDRLKIC